MPEPEKSISGERTSSEENNEEDEAKAAVVLQSNYRGYKERKKFKERKKTVAGAETDLLTESIEEKEGNEPNNMEEDLGNAANKQDDDEDESTYKAEEIDDSDHTLAPEDEEHTEVGEDDVIQNAEQETVKENEQEKTPGTEAVNLEDETKAATVIQSNFRGHKERKRLQEEGKIPNKIQQGSSAAGDKQEICSEETESTGAQVAADVSSDDIKLDDPDETKAAVVIQSNFRGHKERKRLKEEGNIPKDKKKDPTQEVPELQEDISSDNPGGPDEEKAATVLQSNFRGHRDRKKLKAEKEVQQKAKEENVFGDSEQEIKDEGQVLDVTDVVIERKEETDAEKNNQEEEDAAVKLQSNFRGYKDRKNLKANKEAAKNEAEQLKNFSEEVNTRRAAGLV